MSRSFRRFSISLAALIVLASFAGIALGQEGDPVHCGFCADACHDSIEYGLVVCTNTCGHTAIEEPQCDWMNPCDPESSEPIWNVCVVSITPPDDPE